MSESEERRSPERLGFQLITLPLTSTYSLKPLGVQGGYAVMVNVPIEVDAWINTPSGDALPLHRLSAFQAEIEDMYITTTAVSSESLQILVFDSARNVIAGSGSVVTLQDSAGIKYDGRDIVQTQVISNNDNVNNAAEESTDEIITAGYNKITGWVIADQVLTIDVYIYLASGGTARMVDTLTTVANVGYAFEIPIVAPIMELRFDNDSGTNTTTCEKQVYLSTGA